MVSDLVIVAVVTATPGLIAAVVGVINSIKASRIHVLVNSNYSDQVKKLEALEAKLTNVEDALLQARLINAGLLGAKSS